MVARVLCLLFVVYVAAFITSWSLVQGSRTAGVYLILWHLETSYMNRPRPDLGFCDTEKRKVLQSPT